MKKNNLFLFSFIIFIFICLFVHNFWKYPLWPTVVAAITSASWLFAFADMFYSNHKFSRSIVENYADYPETSIESLERIKRAVDVRLSQLDEFPEANPLRTKQDEVDYYSSVKAQVEILKNDFIQLNEKVTKEKKKSSSYKFLADIFSVLGFLILFCILVFEPIANFFVGMQDSMTVGSFGMILATQLCESIGEDTVLKIQDSIKKNSRALDALKKNFEDEVKYNLES